MRDGPGDMINRQYIPWEYISHLSIEYNSKCGKAMYLVLGHRHECLKAVTRVRNLLIVMLLPFFQRLCCYPDAG